VAVARKLAVIMHRMWLDGTEFRFSASAEGATGVQNGGRPAALVAA
jgi:hypothetical protein